MASPRRVPYVTSWTAETCRPLELCADRGRGIAYVEELPSDRDGEGVLWCRVPSRPGEGSPVFATVHSLRQRRAMAGLLCGVCAAPAGSPEGAGWLVHDDRHAWPGWPEHMVVTEPPVCARCAAEARQWCPALRHGVVAVRARSAVFGVHGMAYRFGGLHPVAVAETIVSYRNPAACWVRATALVRMLHDCTVER
jgi:hypothetical protein